MARLLYLFCTLFLLFTVSTSRVAQAKEHITLSLPESVIAEAISAALPLEYEATSENLQGNLRIINISDLELMDQHLACRLHLAADQLQLLTEMAGHNIRLNVGSVEIDFRTKTRLRFDEKKQTLFVTPVIEEVSSSKDAGGGDIGNALVALLDGREFPISMQDIEPIVAKAGAKTLTITTRIADIRAMNEWLQFFLEPQISAN